MEQQGGNLSIWDTATTQDLLDERQLAEEVPFIGQYPAQDQVKPFLDAERFPHILLLGDPGLGKTQFAKWIAWKRQKPFFERMAPQRPMDLPAYGVMLLDEVHRQRRPEDLFPSMDKGLLTIVAATTKPDKLDPAFKSRFLISLKFRPYPLDEMIEIIEAMSGGKAKNVETFATAAAGNPRTAEKIVLAAEGLKTWNPEEVLKSVRITADGLSEDHFDYLKALARIGRPAGIGQIATTMMSTADQAKQHERILLEMEFVELRSQGRTLTIKGEQYVRYLKEQKAI